MTLPKFVLSFVIFGTTLIGWSQSGLASNYPPDYPSSSECKNIDDKVEVCRIIGYGWVGMKIYYWGPMLSRALSQQGMSVWVKLNGHEGFFNMDLYPGGSNNGDLSKITISQSRYNCFMRPPNYSGWECTEPTPEMKHLLFWAKPDRGSLNANAWDVEVAFNLNNTSVWDNNGGIGSNYQFRFEQYGYIY